MCVHSEQTELRHIFLFKLDTHAHTAAHDFSYFFLLSKEHYKVSRKEKKPRQCLCVYVLSLAKRTLCILLMIIYMLGNGTLCRAALSWHHLNNLPLSLSLMIILFQCLTTLS